MKKYAGEEFLNKLYKDLVHGDEVKHTAKGTNKNEDLAIYLERLERITKQARDKDKVDLLKYFYYKKYIIKKENVPESYFEAQEQIALERGYGHIKYDDNTRIQEIESIISEQKESLDRWLEYFMSEDTKHYPMWFKYYVFQNVMKLGYFDKEKNVFTKRTVSTVKPFIEINREAVAMLYDELYKYLDKQELTDEQLEKLIKNGSFPKIYVYIIKRLDSVKKSSSTSNEGVWKKYEKGSNPEILFNDIHGKGTGWCTAGGIVTASAHLKGGDFHVYYTKDKNGEYTNPRIAIRMEYDKIAEIRGVAEHQNLENKMESVVEEKLNEFPDKDEYKKKVSDMKQLTKIYNKHKTNEELTREELKFLYEVDSYIIGFGYEKDPRIVEIIKKRNIKNDLAFALGISEDEISLTAKEAISGNIRYHYGNLDLVHLTDSEGLRLPKEINGDLNLPGLKSARVLVLPQKINGNVDLSKLKKADKLILPNKIGGSLRLDNLKSINELVLPEEVCGNLYLSGLKSAKGLLLPNKIGGSLYLNDLKSAEGLVLPKTVNGNLNLRCLISAEGLSLPEKVNGELNLNSLTNIDGLILPKEINGDLDLFSLNQIEAFVFPDKIGGNLYLNCLTYAKNLIFPKEVDGYLILSNLKNAERLVLPEKVAGTLDLRNLEELNNLILPKEINRDLNLNSIRDANGLTLPNKVGGNIFMSQLYSTEGLMLPKNDQGEFYIPSYCLYCNIPDKELIEAAKKTEEKQNNYNQHIVKKLSTNI